ncbi:MAG: alpha/beta fold hydrolase [Flavobacteriales bacterium]|nr:alpha/beta fold hydrolase [Flavobacteriales bacterium]
MLNKIVKIHAFNSDQLLPMTWWLIVLLCLIGIYGLIMWLYYLLQERFLFVATTLQLKHTFELASPFEEIFLEGEDGGTIHALHIKSKESKGLILYFHGNTGNLQRWARVAEELTTYDHDVIVVDYRGFGKSHGRRTQELMYADAQRIYEYALKHVSELELVVYGRSLGSGLAVKVAADNDPSKLVLETPYLNMIDVAFYHFPFLPVRFLLRFPFRSDKFIAEVDCPIWIFHGTRDRIVPYSSGLKLYELINEHVEHNMITIPRGRHSNLSNFPLFRDKMNEFLAQ